MTYRRRQINQVLTTLVAACAALLVTDAQAQTTPLQFGVLPNVSARLIVENYQPFRAYLERRTGRQVEIVTAANFKAYHANLMNGKYDLAVTAANLGRLAEVDAGHRVFAIYEPAIPGVLVAQRDKRAGGAADLRGRALALANPQSLVAMKGREWLAGQGLRAGVDFTTVHAPNDDSLARILGSGEAAMAMMSMGEFRAIREELRNNLEILVEFVRVPGFLVLTGRQVDEALAMALHAAVTEFPKHSEATEFFRRTGFQAIRAVERAEISALDSVLADTRRLMNEP